MSISTVGARRRIVSPSRLKKIATYKITVRKTDFPVSREIFSPKMALKKHEKKTVFHQYIDCLVAKKQNPLDNIFGMVNRNMIKKKKGKSFFELTEYSRKNVNDWRLTGKNYTKQAIQSASSAK